MGDVDGPSPQGELERVSPHKQLYYSTLLNQLHLDHCASVYNSRAQQRCNPAGLHNNHNLYLRPWLVGTTRLPLQAPLLLHAPRTQARRNRIRN